MSAPVFDTSEVFDDDYLYFHEPRLATVSDRDVEAIWRLLDLGHGTHVLDLACGHGRIANRLARRGARVAGLDATPLFLERARADAEAVGAEVQYIEGELRSLPWTDGSFDCVISWFTSFGYFVDSDNRLVLQEAHRVLQPDGRLLIEGHNLAETVAALVAVDQEVAVAFDHHRGKPGRAHDHGRSEIADARAPARRPRFRDTLIVPRVGRGRTGGGRGWRWLARARRSC